MVDNGIKSDYNYSRGGAAIDQPRKGGRVPGPHMSASPL